jgi:DNA-binding transcriptional LysR family regulator
MDLNDIVVFTKVVETKSFTGAAEQLGLPKSTVSRKLAQLEERLGVRLVQRTTRKLGLTEIGQAYYERASRIVADLAAAEQVVSDMQAAPRGRVRVTAPIDLSARFMGTIVAEFVAKHPDITVELDATDRIVDLIEEGFDIAIRIGPLPESTLIARKLCTFDMVVVASPGYIDRKGAPATVEALEDHDKLLFAPSPRIQSWTIVNGEQTYDFGRPAKMTTNNIYVVRDALIADGGISVMAEFMIGQDLAEDRVVRVLPEWCGRTTEVHALYAARQNMPPRLSLFLEHLTRSFAPQPWLQQGDS